MAIEAIQQKQGVSRAKAICDDCGAEEVVACAYHRKQKHAPTEPDEAQARNKVAALGWSYVKNKLRCPTCEAKRKVAPMKSKEPEAPTAPGKRQRISIITMLADVYDIDAGRYQQGDTDDTVAEVLGVMPGWVAQIREAEFGPDGGNENIEDLEKRLEAFEVDASAIIKAAEQVTTSAEKKLAEVSAMKADLERIKKAVGPRVRKAAGVSA